MHSVPSSTGEFIKVYKFALNHVAKVHSSRVNALDQCREQTPTYFINNDWRNLIETTIRKGVIDKKCRIRNKKDFLYNFPKPVGFCTDTHTKLYSVRVIVKSQIMLTAFPC